MTCSLSVANPDIDGIGIRVAMYAQAILALLPIGIALLAGDFDEDGFQADLVNDIKMNSTSVLATGCALLVASFIQAGRGSLDLYDAIIVLQLSWLNNLTAAFPTLLRAIIDDDKGIKKNTFSRKLGLYMLHCTVTGAFGIWIFHDIQSWSPGCAQEYFLVMCGQKLQASGPNVRIAVLVISSLAVIPLVNVLVIFVLILLLCNLEQMLCRCNENHTPILALLAWGVPSILIIVGTEQFIYDNRGVISGSANQSDWTFGQILALLLVIFPIWTAFDRISTLYRKGARPREPRDEEEGIALVTRIGIRVSLYVQAVLVIIPIILVSFASKSKAGFTEKLFEDLSLNIATVLVTGGALLISAFVQARLYDFDLYHGLIVLNLSWLNVLTILLPLSVAHMRNANVSYRIAAIKSGPRNVGFVLYLSAVGAYGIWLSYGIQDFGSFTECNSSFAWVAVGRSIQATTPGLRTFFLVVSSMAAFPVVNLYLIGIATILAVFLALVVLIGPLMLLGMVLRCGGCISNQPHHAPVAPTHTSRTRFWSVALSQKASSSSLGWFSGALAAAPSIVIITSTEQLIAFNRQHVEDGENDWTFGQILALLLLVLPLSQVILRIWTEITGGGDSSNVLQPEDREGEGTDGAEANALEKGEGPAIREETATASRAAPASTTIS
ncbi:hypothetical protein CALVIDRAFT_568559 [Calocera viscosa TUFC12733]|uniref:Uncharacterized protein n=1 Tax=Calocera viscosa (strain TUFC12733) TaxID=1330018 RepID=A0A167GWN0_CALVF|nr:hypothetical protein CALVIDRAFT_568559 [Calocera viscosa TUFC12733]